MSENLELPLADSICSVELRQAKFIIRPKENSLDAAVRLKRDLKQHRHNRLEIKQRLPA